METIIYNDRQIEIANLKLKQWQSNIDFIEERIRIQNQEGYMGISPTSQARIRSYSHLDIEEWQGKIDFVLANLEATYKARLKESALQMHRQDMYEKGNRGF